MATQTRPGTAPNRRVFVAGRASELPRADKAARFGAGERAVGLFPAAEVIARGRYAALTSTKPTPVAFSGPQTSGATVAGLFGAVSGTKALAGFSGASSAVVTGEAVSFGGSFAGAGESAGGGGGGEAAGIAASFAGLIEAAAKRGDHAEVARLKRLMRERIREAQRRGGGGGAARGGAGGARGPKPPSKPSGPKAG